MSRPNGASNDGANRVSEETASPEEPGDWRRRHARVELETTDRCVRADPPSDDWQARHSRTKRDD